MSNDLFLRYGKLEVKNDNKVIDLSEFHFQFSISAYMLDTPKSMDIRIFNLKKETVNTILEEGLVITLDAGYVNDGTHGIIFNGAITQIRTGKQNGTDTFIDITAVDNDLFFNQGFISYTEPRASNARQRYSNIYANSSNKPADIEIALNNLNDNKLPRGKVYYGRTRDYLRTEAAQCGATWTVENDTVHVVGINEYRNPEITHVINAETGMIGLPMQTIEGIQVQTLLNPNLKVGQRIELNNDSIQQKRIGTQIGDNAQWFIEHPVISEDIKGFYKIIAISYNGDNRGNNWYSELICSIPLEVLPNQLKYGSPEITQ